MRLRGKHKKLETHPSVTPANAGPKFHVRMPVTIETSSAVGTTLKTMAVSTKLMARVPRSIARESAPVCRPRWYLW